MAQNMENAAAVTEAEAPAALVAEGEAAKKIEGRSPWVLAMQRLRRDRAAMISLGVIVLFILVAIFSPVFTAITGHGVYQQFPEIGRNAFGQPLGPNHTFWLGTDDVGRDILVRIAYGTRMSLLVGVVATLVNVAVGLVIGLAAGYFGGWVDSILARLMDWALAIPFLLFALALASVVAVTPIGPLQPGLPVVIVVLGFFGFAAIGRIVRGQVLSIREKEYIDAARALGAGPWRIMFIDMLPNLLAPLIVYTTLLIPVNIVGEASLSFLGVGIQPPTADWGQMISASSQAWQYGGWWLLVFPSLALLAITLAFNIFGDGVRDAFDPRGSLYV